MMQLNLVDILKDLRGIKLSPSDRAQVLAAQGSLSTTGLSLEVELAIRKLYHTKRKAIEALHQARAKAQLSLAIEDNPERLKEMQRQQRIAAMHQRAQARQIVEDTKEEREKNPLNPYGI
jgi:hypothetical protein